MLRSCSLLALSLAAVKHDMMFWPHTGCAIQIGRHCACSCSGDFNVSKQLIITAQ